MGGGGEGKSNGLFKYTYVNNLLCVDIVCDNVCVFTRYGLNLIFLVHWGVGEGPVYLFECETVIICYFSA